MAEAHYDYIVLIRMQFIFWITISHVIKFAILIGLKQQFNYTAQCNYYIIESKLLFLTALFYRTLKWKTFASWLKHQNKTCYNILQIIQIWVSNYNNKKSQDFKWTKMPDEVESASFSGKSFDSVVSVVSRVHQALNTLFSLP